MSDVFDDAWDVVKGSPAPSWTLHGDKGGSLDDSGHEYSRNIYPIGSRDNRLDPQQSVDAENLTTGKQPALNQMMQNREIDRYDARMRNSTGEERLANQTKRNIAREGLNQLDQRKDGFQRTKEGGNDPLFITNLMRDDKGFGGEREAIPFGQGRRRDRNDGRYQYAVERMPRPDEGQEDSFGSRGYQEGMDNSALQPNTDFSGNVEQPQKKRGIMSRFMRR